MPFALLVLGSSLALAQKKIEPAKVNRGVPREVLIKLRVAPPASLLSRLRTIHNLDVVQPLGRTSRVLRLRSRSKQVSALLLELSLDPSVVHAEPNYTVRGVAVPNDPNFPQLWNLRNTGQTNGTPGADIHATQAWNVNTGSRSNVVAVLDAGVDYNHPDLAANIWSAPAPFSVTIGGQTINCAAGTHGFNAITNSCDPMDDHNHGTHVAGIIGAVGNNSTGVTGVNWQTTILPIKFLNSSLTGTVADAINAIEFAIQVRNHFASTATPVNVRVLSNSYEVATFSETFLNAIETANAADMLFVAAAGNNNSNNNVQPFYPASYTASNVIAVLATDNRDERASFSNYGSTSVHLGAPGTDISSTIRNAAYLQMSGTSMATPHVSGAAALILSQCSSLSLAALKSNILTNVDFLPSLNLTTITGGRLNVDKAIRACATSGFTISASPSTQAVPPGQSVNYAVDVSATGGFNGVVTLSAGGLPTGATASFSPPTVTGSGVSILIITTSGTAPPSTSTVTVTGTSGTDSRNTSVSLTIDAPPVPVSVTPSSGSGASQTFAFLYSDPDGFANISAVNALINSTLSGGNSCWVYYDRAANTLWLARDDTSNWDPLTLGTPAMVQNSQCVVNGIGSSTSGAGNNLTLSLAISFKPAFAGAKTVYMIAHDAAGASSAYEARGSWTVTSGGATPDFALSAAPSSQSIAAGGSAAYTVTVTPAGGFSSTVTFSVSGLPSGATASFSPASVNGSGNSTLNVTTTGSTPGGNFPLTITGTSGSTNRTTSASLNISSAPTSVSVTPASGSGLTQSFSFVYSDTNGFADIASVNVLINSSFSGLNACWVYYSRAANTLWLARDNASAWDSMVLGAPSTLQNSQCSIQGSSSSASGAVNSLTLTLAITFQAAFAGAKTVYMNAADNGGLSGGYQARGTWTVAAGGGGPDFSLTAAPATQNVAANQTVNYTVTISPSGGFNGTVILSASALPSGWTSSFTPPTVTGSGTSTFAVTAPASVTPGATTITITGVSGPLTHSSMVSARVNSAPATVSVTPASGSGATQSFAFLYSDPDGFADITFVNILVNNVFSGVNGCWLYYDRSSNTLWLSSNDTSAWNPIVLGSAGTLQNSQCSINSATSSVTSNRNQLTLNLALTFQPAFSGAKSIYMAVGDSAGANSGYQQRGTWTVP